MLRFTLLLFFLGTLLNNSWAADRVLKTASELPNLTLQNAAGECVTLDNEKAKIYIDRFLHIVIAEMDRSKIPASIKMAQGILESGSGMSDLARQAHNHFGIKCGGSWKGKTFYMWDDDVVKSCFRVFNRDEESYIAHTEFIANPHKLSRYGFLFKLERTDYKGWANGLQKAGYATDKNYPSKLIELIERFKLYKFDQLG
jgi:flagellum-specific peptidoglycan hydrolase FlgJ